MAKESKPQHDVDLPTDYESEECLIGCLLVDSRRYHEVSRDVGPQDFFHDDHRKVYRVIGELQNAGEIDGRPRNDRCPIDIKIIADRLNSQPGERVRLSQYANTIGTGWDYAYYARRIRECSRRRAVVLAGQDMIQMASSVNQSADDLETLVYRRAAELGVGAGTQSQITTIGEVIRRDLIPKIENDIYGSKEDEGFVGTGWYSLDHRIGRLHAGSLVVIAGRTGQGKTSFATNIAAHNALRENKKVLFVTLEQSQREIAEMVWRAQAKVGSVSDAKSDREKRDRLNRMLEQTDVVNSENLRLMEGAKTTIESISAACRMQAITNGLDLVLIDYLSCIYRASSAMNVTYQIEKITQALKQLAKQLRVPIILLCQLSRKSETDKGDEPQLYHLKDSAAIEQDSDVVIFVWRPGNGTESKVKIAKNRHGVLGVLEFEFIGACKQFVEKQPARNGVLDEYNNR